MTDTIVILTEQTLDEGDATRILALHDDETDLRYYVLVPHDPRRSLLAAFLDDLSLLDLRALLKDLRHDGRSRHDVDADADARLAGTLTALRAQGAIADGVVTTDDPLPALGEAVEAHQAREVVVVTRPHAVEDTFHTDWASVARDALGLPVLHLYAGTGYVG